jgi:hypothetical protein
LDEEWIVPGKNRRLVTPRGQDRRVKFVKAKREVFLEHLAATCNVTASAEAAGVSLSAVYRCRMRDAEFRDDWALALGQGYARLEAALLRRAMQGERRTPVNGDLTVAGPDAPDEVDWDKGMMLLRHHQRGLEDARPGTRRLPQRVPIEEAAARLVRRLKALGVRPEEDG